MIPKELIKNKAIEYSKQVNGPYYNELYPNCDETLGEVSEKEFIAGVEFAENYLKDLAIEFAEWCVENEWKRASRRDKYIWWNEYTPINHTSQELFEIFIKEKQKV